MTNTLVNTDRESSQLESGATTLQRTAPKRLLVVEDNDLNRLMLDDYLIFYGYQVLSLDNGANFFEQVVSFQPHLILLDLKLPDIDGYVLLKQLQLNPQLQDIPVIVVSAFAFRADRQRAFNLGARQYFTKPVNLSDLRQAINGEISNCSTEKISS